MSKKKDEKPTQRPEGRPGEHPLFAMVSAGDNRAARRQAKRLLRDPASSDADRAAAREVLSRTGIDPGALAVALVAAAIVALVLALVFGRR